MGNLVFQATLGGQVNLVGPNTASTFNLNVPAVSSTIATLTGTETFTNKTLTAPTLTSPNITTALTLTGAAGTSGQVLTSAGSGAAPTWSSPSSTSISNGTSNVTVNSSGGTITAATAGTTAVTIDTSQNVGIGTGSPSSKLHVAGASGNGLTISGSGATGVFRPSSAGVELGSSSGDNTVFLSGSATERMRITSSGNVGIGTNSPGAKLALNFIGASEIGFIPNTSDDVSNSTFINFNVTNVNIGNIKRNGTSNAVLYNTTSDRRLKENIVDADSAMSVVNLIQVRKYDWKKGGQHEDYGFIAQELAQVVNNVVSQGTTEEDMWAVDYGKLTPLLAKAIQELKAINDTQAATITSQADAITALTARIVALEAK